MSNLNNAQRAYDRMEPESWGGDEQLESEESEITQPPVAEDLVNWLEAQPTSVLFSFAELISDHLQLESVEQLEHWIKQGEIA